MVGMTDDDRPLKDRLPHPYNKDLAGVLRHLNRSTPFARDRLANDPVTAAYIAAGISLVRRNLGPGADRQLRDPQDPESVIRPVLGFLGQQKVADEVAKNPDPFPRQGKTSTLRDRWPTVPEYVADLLSFGLWSMHEPALYDDRIATDAEQLVNGPDFVGAAHRLCYIDLTEFMKAPTFRLSLVAMAAADGDKIIQEALAENSRGALGPWKEVYEAMLRMRGLRMRPGVTIDDLAEMMAAMEAGFVMRGIGIPDSAKIDHEGQRSLYGTAACALLLGVVERVDDDSHNTVEEAVHEMIYGRPTPAGPGE
jgi:hypothetical protein